jgi:alpha-N-acetylglucosaminidase
MKRFAALFFFVGVLPLLGQSEPPQAVLQRLLPGLSQQITLSVAPRSDGRDSFRIFGDKGRVKVEGSSASATLFGVNWYLKYVAHLQISPNGSQLAVHGKLPLPTEVIEKETPYPYRYALNQNNDGYTTPYWTWPRWQHEIDVLAVSGINAMLVERGTDMVLYQTFRDFGYSDEEIRHWITQPAHQNWQLMGNMCCFNEPISSALLEKRTQSAKQIIARLRELGITPVLPGYYGMVPADFAKKHPGAHVVPQGDWNGFTRPAWLDPRDPLFAKVAASFYRHQRELFGDSKIYDMEIFQEGGSSGDVPVKDAARQIHLALEAAHPNAMWMLLAWQANPPPQLLEGVDRKHLLIIDIEQARIPRESREKDFQDAPFLFGGLWEFGGRTTMGANLYDYAVRLPKMGKSAGNLAGTAVFPEGIDNNPMAFDLFTEMAWMSEPVDLASWTAGYVARRYGADDPHAQRAWQILLSTAYAGRADGVLNHGERDAAQESLFNAQPSLDAVRASTWSPDLIRYTPADFEKALAELLRVSPALRKEETYQYDLVDVARQVLANRSRSLLPEIKTAYDSKDEASFGRLTRSWLHLMQLQNDLLATNSFFMVGPWLQYVAAWPSTAEERSRLDYDARSILTTWGDRNASEAGLHDYGNKDWAGLTADYYEQRWRLYFTSLDHALKTNSQPQTIDWFAVGETWNRGREQYPLIPQGDSYAVASQIAKELQLPSEHVSP